MKLLPSQVDQASLLRLGRESISLFERRDFQSLAKHFGYALAFERSPAAAIEEEYTSCVAAFRDAPKQRAPFQPSVDVKYFEPNNTNLFALVECIFAAAEDCPILAELIVSSLGEEKFVALEQVSLATS